MGVGYWSQITNPNDPSAGSVAIIVIATAPAGAMFGAVLGGLMIANRPRLFLATIVPLAVFFIGLYATVETLRKMDRPRTFVLEVTGTPGAMYVGVVSIDGDVLLKHGPLPAKYEFEGFRLKSAFALRSPNGADSIAVKISADGNDLGTGTDSQTGVYQSLKSVGYSETFGGTSRTWHRMTSEEVDRLIEDHAMPHGMLEL